MYTKILNSIKNIFKNRFEEAVAMSSALIIITAIIMDQFLYLQACPMCVLTRYVFGLLTISAIIGIILRRSKIGYILVIISTILGILVTSRQIYIQNMSAEEIAQLPGCSMPFHTQIDYFGVFAAINRTLAGGPSCAEDGWRFILNFAEWGFLFFLIYLISTILRITIR